MKQTIVGMYDRMDDAQAAVRALKDGGFNSGDISLVARDANGDYARTLGGDKHAAAAGGATAGAVLGGLGGLLVGLGALAIPGIGPVIAAGPLAAGFAAIGPVAAAAVGAGAGVVAGGAAGGILGALVDLGVPHDEAQYYAEGVRRGGALVSVTTDENHANQARSIMDRFNTINLDARTAQWRQTGWQGYDPNAGPYTGEPLTTDSGVATSSKGGTRVYPYAK